MFPQDVVCEIMSHMSSPDIKQMCLASKMFEQASKQHKIQKIIRTDKIRKTHTYTYKCNNAHFKTSVDKYVNKILNSSLEICEIMLRRDLSFVTDAWRYQSIYIPLPDFDCLLEKCSNLRIEKRKTFDSFLETCSSIYEDALKTNKIEVQIAVLRLFEEVVTNVSFMVFDKFFK